MPGPHRGSGREEENETKAVGKRPKESYYVIFA